jgi:hypothetical protein
VVVRFMRQPATEPAVLTVITYAEHQQAEAGTISIATDDD